MDYLLLRQIKVYGHIIAIKTDRDTLDGFSLFRRVCLFVFSKKTLCGALFWN